MLLHKMKRVASVAAPIPAPTLALGLTLLVLSILILPR
jgi:hypothetical protein